jgi:hypothetical protein
MPAPYHISSRITLIRTNSFCDFVRWSQYKNRVEQDYIAYNLAKSAKGKKKKKR